jgi:hypothetical protein
MTDVRIVVDAKTIRPGSAGPATGDVWIVLGQREFPFQNWNDFVVVILEAWAAVVVRILRGFSKLERVHFMEGPYMVEVSCASGGLLRLRAVERAQQEQEIACEDTRALDFIDGLVVCSEEVLAACRQRNCWSVDADRLEAILPLMRRRRRS